MTDSAAAAPAASDAPVEADAKMLAPQQRTVELLGKAGLFASDDDRGAILAAKRINHLLYGDRSKEGLSPELLAELKTKQETYRQEIQTTPYEDLIKKDRLNDMLVEYVNFLLARSKEKLKRLQEGQLQGTDENDPASLFQLIQKESSKIGALNGELKTYEKGSDYARQMFTRIEKLVKLDRYKPLGQLVIESGLVKEAQGEAMSDLVYDVLGVAAANDIKKMADRFDCVKALDEARCKVVAKAELQATRPLASLFEFEPQNEQLDRITALRTLLSAQLHAVFSMDNLSPEQLVQMEKDAKILAHEYAEVGMSLAYHYLCDGPAKNDPRVKNLRSDLVQEMAESGVALIPNIDDAISKAQELAKASAADLLTATKGDEQLSNMLNKLTEAASKANGRREILGKYAKFAQALAEQVLATKIGSVIPSRN